MKKITLVAIALALFIGYQLNAKVLFLPDADESVGARGNEANPSCIEAGYTETTCSGALVDPCPDDSHYYKTCCPSGYKYPIQHCGANISADNCHGYYKCTPNEAGLQAAAEQTECAAAGYTIPAGPNPCPKPSTSGCYTVYDKEVCPHSSSYVKCVVVGNSCSQSQPSL